MLKLILEEIKEIKKEVYDIKKLITPKNIDVKCFGNIQNLDIEHQIRKVLKTED